MKFISVIIFVILFLISSMFTFLQLKQESIKIGLLYSATGTMSLNEKPLAEILKAAVKDTNAKGGLLKRKIEIIEYDGKSDSLEFKKGAKELIDQGVVSIFGCWTSASRKEVKEVVEAHDNLLFYPLQYEGFESSKNIVYLGLSANQQINPAIDFTLTHFGKKIYLVGSEYIYPKAANLYIKELAKLTDIEIVGESYYPLGSNNFGSCFDDIALKKPAVIINTINGDSNIEFFKQLKISQRTRQPIPVISLSLDEILIKEIPAEAISGHYSIWGYFNTFSIAKTDFNNMIKENFGHDMLITDPMFSTYLGIELFKQAIVKSKDISPKSICQNIKRTSINIGGNIFYVDGKNQHLHRRVFIGKIDSKGEIERTWESQKIIAPEPFPSFKSEEFWRKNIEDIYLSYGNSWEMRGVAK